MTETIETERLILRHWLESDAPALYRYASEPRVSQMALWPCHTSVDMSRYVIQNYFIPNPSTFAIVLKSTLEPIGCIGLVPQGDEHHAPLPGEREVGYWIGLPHWNSGFTTEALRALIAYCSDSMHLNSLLITTDARNAASQRVAIKCGFTQFDEYIHDGIPSQAYRLRTK